MIQSSDGFLNGHLLLAMPTIGDPRFEKAAIYVCAHDEKGAMGIVINNIMPDVEFGSLLKDLDIASDIHLPQNIFKLPVMQGGPVEIARGFLIHSNDFEQRDTIKVQNDIYVTGTIDGLMAISKDMPPQNMIFALGYAGWESGQLEREVQDNAWLTLPATKDLVFKQDAKGLWSKALNEIGVTPEQLTQFSGHA